MAEYLFFFALLGYAFAYGFGPFVLIYALLLGMFSTSLGPPAWTVAAIGYALAYALKPDKTDDT